MLGGRAARARTSAAALPWPMRVLVTGGAGFIGSHFVKRLVAAGEDVVVLDKLTYAGNPANLEGVDAELVVGDIADPDAVAEAGAGCDAVGQLRRRDARRPLDPRASRADRDERRRARRCCSTGRARPARGCVHVSTDEVYGDLEAGGSSREDDPLRPSSPYSAAKAGGDLQVLAYVRTYGVDALHHARLEHLRAEPVPGEAAPALRHERARRRAAAALRRRPPGARLAATSRTTAPAIEPRCAKGRAGEVYNVGGGDERENREITQHGARGDRRRRVARAAGRGPRRATTAATRSTRRRSAPSSAGSRSVALDDGFARTVDWYREQPRLVGADQGRASYREYYEPPVRRAAARAASRQALAARRVGPRDSLRLPWICLRAVEQLLDAVAAGRARRASPPRL